VVVAVVIAVLVRVRSVDTSMAQAPCHALPRDSSRRQADIAAEATTLRPSLLPSQQLASFATGDALARGMLNER